jgi:two-component system response regulator DesR
VSVRVLLADDEHLIRGALAALLSLEDDLAIVAEAATGPEALAMARAHEPDVAVLDLQMPGADGVKVATSLRTELPSCKVLIVTSHGRPGHLRRALEAGVRGFVPKTVSARRLAEIIRTVHAGNRYVDPELAADAISAGDSPLTVREAARRGDRRTGRALAGDRAELPVVGRLQTRRREPSHGRAARAGARLGIVVLAPRRMRT